MANDGQTHHADCYVRVGHHDCAVREVERLRRLLATSNEQIVADCQTGAAGALAVMHRERDALRAELACERDKTAALTFSVWRVAKSLRDGEADARAGFNELATALRDTGAAAREWEAGALEDAADAVLRVDVWAPSDRTGVSAMLRSRAAAIRAQAKR